LAVIIDPLEAEIGLCVAGRLQGNQQCEVGGGKGDGEEKEGGGRLHGMKTSF
jgi:hypothetical protein